MQVSRRARLSYEMTVFTSSSSVMFYFSYVK